MDKFASRMELAVPSFIRESLKLAADPNIISFAGGNPDAELFPWDELADCANRAINSDWKTAFQYSVTEGYSPLIDKILEIMHSIGVEAERKNVSIISGSQQGLDLFAKAYIDKGDKIIVESPTYMGAVNAFKYYEPEFIEVSTDKDGMRPDSLEQALKEHPDTKFIYTIPDFQNPTGLVLKENRRKEIVELAEKYDVMVIEDNPYYFLRYDGEIIPPIKHFDKYGRVIFLGSFSKILCPGLRVGWVVAAEDVVQKMVYLKQAADLHTAELSQRIVFEYLDNCDMDAHIRLINQKYSAKKNLMLRCLEKFFPKNLEYTKPDGGLFLWMTMPKKYDSSEIFNRAYNDIGVIFVPGDTFYPYGGHPNTARFSFATVSEDKIASGMKKLGELFSEIIV